MTEETSALELITALLAEYCQQSSRSPTEITEFLFLGDFSDADSHGMLKEMGFTHVLNCAGSYSYQQHACPYSRATGVVGYKVLDADDNENYDMSQHFEEGRQFINEAKDSSGKVLVHCAKGRNRSAALCVAYLMMEQGLALMDALARVAKARGRVLTNKTFQRQLIQFEKMISTCRHD